MNDLVYLAGGITGLSYEEAISWRIEAAQKLRPLRALSPLRAKTYLNKELSIAGDYPSIPLSTSRGITTRDRFDCQRSGCVIFYLLGARYVSIGTVLEMAWADAAGVPSVYAVEPEGNPHEHAMVRELMDFRVETLDEAVHIARCVLLPEPFADAIPTEHEPPPGAEVLTHHGIPYGYRLPPVPGRPGLVNGGR
jgi:hypothetical protein